MVVAFRAASAALLLSGALLAGCAGDGNDGLFTTGALGTPTTAAVETKIDPACITLTSRIEGLRREGIADKVEKASAKKYKMTQVDLSKADQLNKANAEFHARCSQLSPSRPSTAQNSPPPTMSKGSPKSAGGPGNAY